MYATTHTSSFPTTTGKYGGVCVGEMFPVIIIALTDSLKKLSRMKVEAAKAADPTRTTSLTKETERMGLEQQEAQIFLKLLIRRILHLAKHWISS